MKSIKVESWISIAANVGVIIGLVLVFIQIKQNTDITKAQIKADYHLHDMALELKMMGDHPVASFTKSLYSPEELTNEDRAVLDRYFNYGLIRLYHMQAMRELGLVDDDLSEEISYLGWHFGNEIGRRWWGNIKTELDPGFVKKVDEALETEN